MGEGHRTPADAWEPGTAAADWHDAREEASLVAAVIDPAEVHAERVTPVFFGSALTNVGLSLLLDAFPAFSVPPAPRQFRKKRASYPSCCLAPDTAP